MLTSVRDTSLEAYDDLRNSGKLTKQQNELLTFISDNRDYSLRELSEISGMEINVVSGRAWELKHKKILVEGEKRKCSITGRTIHPVKLNV